MSETLRRVQALVMSGDYIVSRHGFRELAADAIVGEEAIAGVVSAIVVEDYRILVKSRPYWSCSATGMVAPFTSCGAFQRVPGLRQYW